MTHLLLVTAQGAYHMSFIAEFTKVILKSNCNIQECRIATLGTECATIMLLSGTWSEIAKMETFLSSLEQKVAIKVHTKRTAVVEYSQPHLPYAAHLVALDSPGILYQLSTFFSKFDVHIKDLSSSTNAHVLQMSLKIALPAVISISDFREQFMELCDELNIDAILEPEKNPNF